MIKVVYITCYGRSGSTVFERLINTVHAGSFACGELSNLLDFFDHVDNICSCTVTLKDCSVWSPVYQLFSETIPSLSAYRSSHRYYESRLPFTAPPSNLISYGKYLEQTLSLYKCISSVTKKSILIDSSKSPIRLRDLYKVASRYPEEFSVSSFFLYRSPFDIWRSVSRSWQKDVPNGIQHPIPSMSLHRFIASYLLLIFSIIFFSRPRFIRLSKLRNFDYISRKLLQSPFLKKIDLNLLLRLTNNEIPLSSSLHQCAGNRNRTFKTLYLR